MSVRSILLAAAFFGVTTDASADPLVAGSKISLMSYVEAIGSVSVNAATGLDFVSGPSGPASIGIPGTVSSYGTGTGSFANLSCDGNCGSIQDILSLTIGAHVITSFLSLAGGNNTSPIIFDLASITSIDRSSPTSLSLVASGTIRYGAADPTPATFTFVAQGDQMLSFFGTTISLSAGSGVGTGTAPGASVDAAVSPLLALVPAPEPGSLALLVSGLAALAAFRPKRLRAHQAVGSSSVATA